MAEIKLPKLPDRTPVKLTIVITPKLHKSLQDYASIYAEQYGRDEPVTELIPAIVTAFLETDRAFNVARKRLAGETS